MAYIVFNSVWSVGITSIEMFEGRPPLSDIHPMRAIFLIPSRPPPTLKEQSKVSAAFNDFIGRCLVKSAASRPTAAELLEHTFIKESKSVEVLMDMIQEAVRRRNIKESQIEYG